MSATLSQQSLHEMLKSVDQEIAADVEDEGGPQEEDDEGADVTSSPEPHKAAIDSAEQAEEEADNT